MLGFATPQPAAVIRALDSGINRGIVSAMRRICVGTQVEPSLKRLPLGSLAARLQPPRDAVPHGTGATQSWRYILASIRRAQPPQRIPVVGDGRGPRQRPLGLVMAIVRTVYVQLNMTAKLMAEVDAASHAN